MWAEHGMLPSEIAKLPRHELGLIIAFMQKYKEDTEKMKKRKK